MLANPCKTRLLIILHLGTGAKRQNINKIQQVNKQNEFLPPTSEIKISIGLFGTAIAEILIFMRNDVTQWWHTRVDIGVLGEKRRRFAEQGEQGIDLAGRYRHNRQVHSTSALLTSCTQIRRDSCDQWQQRKPTEVPLC